MSVAEANPAQIAAPEEKLSDEKIAYVLALVIVALGAVLTIAFGLPGLAMTALALVPVVYATLLLLTFGK